MLAKTGTVIGDPRYISPEQNRGKPAFASDIYSLGVTCIHLLTQVCPFDLFDTDRDNWVWRDYLVDNPVDEKLGKVLDKMIANSLSQRYQSVVEVFPDLGDRLKEANVEQIILSSNPPITKSKFRFKTAKLEIIAKKETITKVGLLGFKKQVEVEKQEFKVTQIPVEAEYIIEDLGNGVNIEMVYIPAGSFMMGSNEDPAEQPIHRVTLLPFYVGKYAIARKQYVKVMSERGWEPFGDKGGNYPMETTWSNTIEFCKSLSQLTGKQYTLPSESQWEYVCRGGTSTSFYFGETIIPTLGNYRVEYPDGERPLYSRMAQSDEVGEKLPNAFGLYDMHGNVHEWCLDTWHENYTDSPVDGSAWVDNSNNLRVLRGGSYSCPAKNCRSSSRSSFFDVSGYNAGFRVVLISMEESIQLTQ
jgi:formylglycine-generating enzyme required for sulfatase activity